MGRYQWHPFPPFIGRLLQLQVKFWQDLYCHTMIEFLYVNKLERRDREIRLEVTSAPAPHEEDGGEGGESLAMPSSSLSSYSSSSCPRHVLVPLGGGKDSIVVYECLKRQLQQQEEKEEGEEMVKVSWCHVSDGYGEYDRNPYLNMVVAISGAKMVSLSSSLSCIENKQ